MAYRKGKYTMKAIIIIIVISIILTTGIVYTNSTSYNGIRCNYVGNKPAKRVECKGGGMAAQWQNREVNEQY